MFLLFDIRPPTPPGKEPFVLVLAALMVALFAVACVVSLIIFFVRRRRKAGRATDAAAPARTGTA
jgi:heme/copper-type cytochrome/quinol oxidase subunit 2